MSLRRAWCFQVGVALSQLLNTVLGGWADESTSSRAWRAHKRSRRWAAMRRLIDALLGRDHCKQAFLSEIVRAQLPPELRDPMN